MVKKKRKRRSDYVPRGRGRPIKKSEPYSEGIKVAIYEIREMTELGRRRWGKYGRRKKNLTYNMIPPSLILPYYVNNDGDLGDWLYSNFGVGLFVIRSWTSCRWTPTGRKLTKDLARVRVRGPDSFVVLDKKGLSRYGFWRQPFKVGFRERMFDRGLT